MVFDEGAGRELSAVKDEAWTARTLVYEEEGACDQFFVYDAENDDSLYLNCTADTKVFVRYSATEWRLISATTPQDLIKTAGWEADHLYYIATKEGPSADSYREVTYVVAGSYKDGAIVPPPQSATSYFDQNGKGWSEGNIKLDGSMTSGGSAPDTGVAFPAMVVVAGLASAGVLIGVSRKKKEAA